VPELEQNLLPGVELGPVRAAFEKGAGNELEEKLRAVHSSAALVVNAFQPWSRTPAGLALGGRQGFSSLRFEEQLPVFASSHATPAHLDLLADGPQGAVAVESKLTELLLPRKPEFSRAYDRFLQVPEVTAWSPWIERLRESPTIFSWLDAAQLVKHALALRRARPTESTVLLYLYWEPTNAGELSAFQEHREEVSEFARSVASDRAVLFESASHLGLWRFWASTSEPAWLADHAQRLIDRYAVAI